MYSSSSSLDDAGGFVDEDLHGDDIRACPCNGEELQRRRSAVDVVEEAASASTAEADGVLSGFRIVKLAGTGRSRSDSCDSQEQIIPKEKTERIFGGDMKIGDEGGGGILVDFPAAAHDNDEQLHSPSSTRHRLRPGRSRSSDQVLSRPLERVTGGFFGGGGAKGVSDQRIRLLASELVASNAERDSLRDELDRLRLQLKERDMELTALRLDSLDDAMGGWGTRSDRHGDNVDSSDDLLAPPRRSASTSGSSDGDDNIMQVPAEEWRTLHAERDTALARAGELATQLANCMADADEQQEILRQTRQILEETRELVRQKEKELIEREREVQRYKKVPSRQRSDSITDTENAEANNHQHHLIDAGDSSHELGPTRAVSGGGRGFFFSRLSGSSSVTDGNTTDPPAPPPPPPEAVTPISKISLPSISSPPSGGGLLARWRTGRTTSGTASGTTSDDEQACASCSSDPVDDGNHGTIDGRHDGSGSEDKDVDIKATDPSNIGKTQGETLHVSNSEAGGADTDKSTGHYSEAEADISLSPAAQEDDGANDYDERQNVSSLAPNASVSSPRDSIFRFGRS